MEHEPTDQPDKPVATVPDRASLTVKLLLAGAVVLTALIALPFLPALVWALALCVLVYPIEARLRRSLALPWLSVSIVVVATGVIIVVPFLLIGSVLLSEALNGFDLLEQLLSSDRWRKIGVDYPAITPAVEWTARHFEPSQLLRGIADRLGSWSAGLIQDSLLGILTLLMTFYFLFYFLRDRRRILGSARLLVPLEPGEFDALAETVSRTIYASVYGTIAVAALQGLLAGLMFWWLGLPSPVFWGVIMGLLAIVPFLGAFVVWVPVAIVLAINGHLGSAAILTAWGLIVVGLIDNVAYPILVGKQLAMHSMVSFIAIVGGLLLFGTYGIVLGPIVVASAVCLLQIRRERDLRGQQDSEQVVT
ncbi:MAG: AI-2E family transporter [Alphaproteobacteria bacterium]|nr:AI-2E family transporter [Alphaproteobacteria bacterium]